MSALKTDIRVSGWYGMWYRFCHVFFSNYHPKSVHGPFSHEKRYNYNVYHFSVQYQQCFLFWTQLRTDPLQSMTAVTICMFSHRCLRRTLSPSAISISFAWIISSAIPFFSASRSHIFLVHVLWIIEWSVKNSPYFPLKYHFRQNISRIRMSRCSIHGKILGLLILPIPLLHLSNFPSLKVSSILPLYFTFSLRPQWSHWQMLLVLLFYEILKFRTDELTSIIGYQ